MMQDDLGRQLFFREPRPAGCESCRGCSDCLTYTPGKGNELRWRGRPPNTQLIGVKCVHDHEDGLLRRELRHIKDHWLSCILGCVVVHGVFELLNAAFETVLP